MTNIKVMYSSKSEEWATPDDFFSKLDEEFNFTLDPCATPENAKCKKFYTKQQNGLLQDWKGETVFCNPPYGKGLENWVKKCYEHGKAGFTAVMLIFARTDTKVFHEYIYNHAELRFIKGRLKFGGCKNSAPFPSMLVIYNGKK